MEYGISLLSTIPVRKEPDERSEMVSQILFGEYFTMLKLTTDWIYIRLGLDHYTGWIDRKMATGITSDTFTRLQREKSYIVRDRFLMLENRDKITFPIAAGSSLPFLDRAKGKFHIEEDTFHVIGPINQQAILASREELINFSKQFLHSPYLWGGKTAMGIDCSGFTQLVYKAAGINIPRDARDQVNEGNNLNFIDQAKPGDLAFFENEEGNIIHTGILLGDHNIIHASGSVRIDKIDHRGIFNKERNTYSHRLNVIKSIWK